MLHSKKKKWKYKRNTHPDNREMCIHIYASEEEIQMMKKHYPILPPENITDF